jgi:glucose/arabinose dehydrogenase
MLSSHRCTYLRSVLAVFAALCAGSSQASPEAPAAAPQPTAAACPQNDSGLKLPPGFCATIFADGVGHARHLVVAPDGVVYVNTWSGRYVLEGQLNSLFGPADPTATSKPFQATAIAVGAS